MDKLALKMSTGIRSLKEMGDESHPIVKRGINPSMYYIAQELYYAAPLNLVQRKQKLRTLFIEDFLRESAEMNMVDLAYMSAAL